MGEINSQKTIEVASTRLDEALASLEEAVKQYGDQNKIISQLQKEIEKLSYQKSTLNSDLIAISKREKILNASASDVSKKLIDSMETIKSILVKQG